MVKEKKITETFNGNCNTNLYFYHDTGWGTAWEKIILVKYTKD